MTDYSNFHSDAAVAAHLATPEYKIVEQALLVNENIKTLKLDVFQEGRFRPVGTFETSSIVSFAHFVKDNADANNEPAIFVDKDTMKAVAILNYQVDGFAQGHLDHTATITAKPTVVFEKIRQIALQGRLSQRAFAEFLEDWGFAITAKNADGEDIALNTAIGVVRNMQLSAGVIQDSQVGNFKESRPRLATIEARSAAGVLPTHFVVKDQCYQGLPQSEIILRLTVGNQNDEPCFALGIVSYDALIDQKSEELINEITKQLGGFGKLYLGKFKG